MVCFDTYSVTYCLKFTVIKLIKVSTHHLMWGTRGEKGYVRPTSSHFKVCNTVLTIDTMLYKRPL